MRSQNEKTKENGSSNGGNPQSKIIPEELVWWFRYHDEMLDYISSKGDDIDEDDSRTILDHQFEILSRKGFDYIYRKEDREKIRNGEIVPTDEQKLTYLKRHLKQRISDFFKRKNSQKNGGGKIAHMDEHEFFQTEDLGSYNPYEACAVNDLRYRAIHLAKKLLRPNNLFKYSERERIVIAVAKREGLVRLKRNVLYALMTETERSTFLPQNGKPVKDEVKSIKTAIYKTIVQLPVTTANILRSDQGN